MHPYRLILLLFYFAALACPAQEPFHYRIGSQELAGIDIYGLYQDSQANVWIATDQGLFRYDSYQFYPYPCAELRSSSLFVLKESPGGEMFCLNLSGQILHVVDDSLQVYYQLPDSLLSSLMDLHFDDRGDLIVGGTQLVRINPEKQLEVISRKYFLEFKSHPEGGMICRESLTGGFYRLWQGRLHKMMDQPAQLNQSTRLPRPWILQGETVQHIDLEGSRFLSQPFEGELKEIKWDAENFKVQPVLLNSMVSPAGNFWLSLSTRGVLVLDPEGKGMYGKKPILDKYRISSQMLDHEGNHWLGTLGRGIILIPNHLVLDYSNHPLLKDQFLSGLTCDSLGQIYINSELNGGSLVRISGDHLEALPWTGIGGNSNYFGLLDGVNVLISAGVRSGWLDLRTGNFTARPLSSLKDAWPLGPDEVLVGNESSVFLLRYGEQTSPAGQIIRGFPGLRSLNANSCSLTGGRSTCIAYHDAEQKVWIGMEKGLFYMDSTGMHEFTLAGKKVLAQDLEIWDSGLWVATKKEGLLALKNEKVYKTLQQAEGLVSPELLKLKAVPDYLYILSREGLQRLHRDHRTFDSFGKKDGLTPGTAHNFAVHQGKVWLQSPDGLLSFRFEDLQPNPVPPVLELTEIRINDQARSREQAQSLSYDQNKLEFHFAAKAFRHRETLRYQYRLLGWEEDWLEQGFEKRSVIYNALPPGDFQFELQAFNEDGVGSEIQRHEFRILHPFWMRGWFWVGSALLLAAVVSGLFLLRIRLLRRRLNLEKKLKNSELTAIKAQMNPHFVFNVLNSLQDLIYQKDFRKTNAYLGRFAGLMRKTLEFSERNAITLAEEWELLEDYLALEKLRFGEDLQLTFDKELRDISAEEIEIPPMLLQPYLENAFKHGLLHKKGDKQLRLAFYWQGQDLICEIEDNGIGRAASQKLKARRPDEHQAFATTATQKRIDLINQTRERPIILEVVDLLSEEGVASGTLVRVIFTRMRPSGKDV